MHENNIVRAGLPLQVANKAMILTHGRGGSAQDILSLAAHFDLEKFALLAPQATNNTWYPSSFMAPVSQNEPALSAALALLDEAVSQAVAAGINYQNLFFLGFSQGACLTLEYAARRARRYGGIIAFTGGVIGEKINMKNYQGAFDGAPVFIGSSNPDPHVPVERVTVTAELYINMGARVNKKIYEGMGHTINQDEISQAKTILAQ